MKKTYIYNKETKKMKLKKSEEVCWMFGVDLPEENIDSYIMGLKVKACDALKKGEWYIK